MWIVLGVCIGLGLLVLEQLYHRRRVKRSLPKAESRPDMESISVGNVYIRTLKTSGSVRIQANSDGVYVESDAGGRVVAVINGQEIETELAPGEKRFLS